jgi:hypothetical protein
MSDALRGSKSGRVMTQKLLGDLGVLVVNWVGGRPELP